MPLLKVNASATGLQLHTTSIQADYSISDLASVPGPAVIMVHGYKYAPGSVRHCPHRKLFNTSPKGWLHGLGFDGTRYNEGIGIAMGWYARGPLHKVHHRARALGEDLAGIVERLRCDSPDRPVNLIAHSMGAEVVLSALSHLTENTINRIILLTGASHQSSALKALQTPAGRSAEVLNVVSRENDLFDAMFEHLVPSKDSASHAIGRGIAAGNVVNLQIDCYASLKALTDLSFPVTAPDKLICHWSSYRRDGLMHLYDRFLRDPDNLTLAALAEALPETAEPRWSKIPAMSCDDFVMRSSGLQEIAGKLRFLLSRRKTDQRGSRPREHAY